MSDLIIFTSKSKAEMIAQGGTGWWKLNATRLVDVDRIVFCHNSRPTGDHRADRDSDKAQHGKPFLVGKHSGYRTDDRDGRKLITLSQIADVTGGEYEWPGVRNPTIYSDEPVDVDYADCEDVTPVDFKVAKSLRDMAPETEPAPSNETPGEIVERYRNDLAEELGIAAEAVKITITF